MKVRELIPLLVDGVSYFIVYDSVSGDLIYDGATHEEMQYDIGDTDIRYVYFKDCEGEFPNTTNTICVITVSYYWKEEQTVHELEEVIRCELKQ